MDANRFAHASKSLIFQKNHTSTDIKSLIFLKNQTFYASQSVI